MIRFIYEIMESLTVVHIGTRRRASDDQRALGIHFRGVLLAKVGLLVLLNPPNIASVLSSLGRVNVELGRTLSFLDALVLFTGAMLPQRIHNASLVHNEPLLFCHFA